MFFVCGNRFTFFHQPPPGIPPNLETPRLHDSKFIWRNLLTSHGEKTSLEELERCFEALVGDASIHRALEVEFFFTPPKKKKPNICQKVKDHENNSSLEMLIVNYPY